MMITEIQNVYRKKIQRIFFFSCRIHIANPLDTIITTNRRLRPNMYLYLPSMPSVSYNFRCYLLFTNHVRR